MKHEIKVYVSKVFDGRSSSYLHFLKVNGKTKEDAVNRLLKKDLNEFVKKLY